MIVTFCGHGRLPTSSEVRQWLEAAVAPYLGIPNVVFYFGGYGEFDRLAAAVVREKKDINGSMERVLVIPYLDRQYDCSGYDGTTYPPLESVPRRYAISKRNEWMVDNADVVIAYVTHSWGGAATTLEYAKRRKKKIICYPDTD